MDNSFNEDFKNQKPVEIKEFSKKMQTLSENEELGKKSKETLILVGKSIAKTVLYRINMRILLPISAIIVSICILVLTQTNSGIAKFFLILSGFHVILSIILLIKSLFKI